MSKYIFKGINIKDLGQPVEIKLPVHLKKDNKTDLSQPSEDKQEPDPESQHLEQEQIRQKKEALEQEFKNKRLWMDQELEKTKTQLDQWAMERIRQANEFYENKLKELDKLQETRILKAKEEAESLINQARLEISKNEDQVYQKGYKEGLDSGYKVGREEVDRLIGRLNVILSSIIKKRNEIMEEAEKQLVDIILIIARKVVKKIVDQDEQVVYRNVLEALKVLKSSTEVAIRVNLQDLDLATQHKDEFVNRIEGIEHLKILEDSSVERGGCYIDTDFGSINAKISTQLSHIEEQIKKMSPLGRQSKPGGEFGG